MAMPTCRTACAGAYPSLIVLSRHHPVELEKVPKKVKLIGAPKDLNVRLLLDA